MTKECLFGGTKVYLLQYSNPSLVTNGTQTSFANDKSATEIFTTSEASSSSLKFRSVQVVSVKLFTTTMVSQSTMLRAIRRRPLTALSVAGTAGIVSYAAFVEWRSEQEEELLKSGITSVHHHQEIPSLPRVYNKEALNDYWKGRPITTAKRLVEVTYELAPRLGAYLWDFHISPSTTDDDKTANEELQSVHARKLKEALTRLGPAFVKGGQQLSIRPDLVSPIVLKELQRLCDSVQPIPDEVALQLLKDELKCEDLNDLFDDLHLVASASLGQVYKATLKDSGETVAIKVQRPDMLKTFSLDLYIFQKLSYALDSIFTQITEQSAFREALSDDFSRGSYSELDYEQEAANQIRFQTELAKRNCKVKVPSVYQDLTTQKVITTEWIDGVKLADAPQSLINKLIPVGVELFLTQLLDIGSFHADPHPVRISV